MLGLLCPLWPQRPLLWFDGLILLAQITMRKGQPASQPKSTKKTDRQARRRVIGARVAEMREVLGMTQVAFVGRLNEMLASRGISPIDVPQLSRVENGARDLTLEEAVVLGDLADGGVHWLVFGEAQAAGSQWHKSAVESVRSARPAAGEDVVDVAGQLDEIPNQSCEDREEG